MRKWRKALSVALASALLIPLLTTTVFGALNAELYSGYIQGNTILGETQTLTDPSVRDKYNDLIFVTGEPGSASASGYGSFYTYRSTTGAYAYEFGYANPVAGGDGRPIPLMKSSPSAISNGYCTTAFSSWPTTGLTLMSRLKSTVM